MKTIITTLFILFSFVSFSQLTSLEQKVVKLVKEYKLKLNGDEVTEDSKISLESRTYSKTMISNNALKHDPNLGYQSEIIQKANSFGFTEENLAQKILNNFLNSPSHKELIDENSRKIGVGIIITKENYAWVTIRFE
jgi:uncharacterized protein YkwD